MIRCTKFALWLINNLKLAFFQSLFSGVAPHGTFYEYTSLTGLVRLALAACVSDRVRPCHTNELHLARYNLFEGTREHRSGQTVSVACRRQISLIPD